ncbi:MAG TPA: hypothetical protein VL688_01720 [Verrucomicrobiae bacterium]|nr:hypothetical protein [Verrucomicrobiae bacterium]
MRWLVLEEILEICRGREARTRSRVPSGTVSPETLMTEMMAQTAALVLGAEKDYADDLIFAKIQELAFTGDFAAGDFLEITAFSDQLREEGAWFECSVSGPSGKIAGGKILLMNVGHLVPGRAEPVTFHKAFMDHFSVRLYLGEEA